MADLTKRNWLGPWRFERLYGWWWRQYQCPGNAPEGHGRVATIWRSVNGSAREERR